MTSSKDYPKSVFFASFFSRMAGKEMYEKPHAELAEIIVFVYKYACL